MDIKKDYNMAHNSWSDNDPASIMIHTTLGSTVLGAVDTLLKRGLSYNYLIDDGNVYELVSYDRSAWHAGVTDKVTLRASVFYKGENPNKHSVGIAYVQPQGIFSLSEGDISAGVELIKWIGSQTGVRYTADNIFYHREVTSYKPLEAKYYMEQTLEALIGDKDDKDAMRKTVLKLRIELLRLQLAVLMRKIYGK